MAEHDNGSALHNRNKRVLHHRRLLYETTKRMEIQAALQTATTRDDQETTYKTMLLMKL